MAKSARMSLAGVLAPEASPAAPASPDAGIPASPQAGIPVYGEKKLKRPPHVAVYMNPAVNFALKEIALTKRCKVHDLMLEGVRRILAEHGKDFDSLNRKD